MFHFHFKTSSFSTKELPSSALVNLSLKRPSFSSQVRCPLSFTLPPKNIHELLTDDYKENKNKRRQVLSKFKVLENPTFYLLHFGDYINAETF